MLKRSPLCLCLNSNVCYHLLISVYFVLLSTQEQLKISYDLTWKNRNSTLSQWLVGSCHTDFCFPLTPALYPPYSGNSFLVIADCSCFSRQILISAFSAQKLCLNFSSLLHKLGNCSWIGCWDKYRAYSWVPFIQRLWFWVPIILCFKIVVSEAKFLYSAWKKTCVVFRLNNSNAYMVLKYQMTILPKVIDRFSAIPIKLLMACFLFLFFADLNNNKNIFFSKLAYLF